MSPGDMYRKSAHTDENRSRKERAHESVSPSPENVSRSMYRLETPSDSPQSPLENRRVGGEGPGGRGNPKGFSPDRLTQPLPHPRSEPAGQEKETNPPTKPDREPGFPLVTVYTDCTTPGGKPLRVPCRFDTAAERAAVVEGMRRCYALKPFRLTVAAEDEHGACEIHVEPDFVEVSR